jgi:hypothetical protein
MFGGDPAPANCLCRRSAVGPYSRAKNQPELHFSSESRGERGGLTACDHRGVYSCPPERSAGGRKSAPAKIACQRRDHLVVGSTPLHPQEVFRWLPVRHASVLFEPHGRGSKQWDPTIHGRGLAPLNISASVDMTPERPGQPLPPDDNLEFRLVTAATGNRSILCENLVLVTLP